jgi:cytochrome c553
MANRTQSLVPRWAPILLFMLIQPVSARDQSASDLLNRAMAATPDLAHGEALFRRSCVRCHEARGSGTGAREFPRLAGQQREYLLQELVQFITLDRYAPQMHQILIQPDFADPQSLSDLSSYLAALHYDSFGEHGDGHRIGRGRQIYNERCAGCHGAAGEGRAQVAIPAVGGQNYTYLLTQLGGFAAGHRGKVESSLADAVGSLSRDDMRAVADFMSRMPESVDPHYGVVDVGR